MLGAHAGDAARLDLAAIGDVATKHLGVLVVDVSALVLAERALLASRLTSEFGHCFLLTVFSREDP